MCYTQVQCGSYSLTGYFHLLCCTATDCVCIELNITSNWVVRESQNVMPVLFGRLFVTKIFTMGIIRGGQNVTPVILEGCF